MSCRRDHPRVCGEKPSASLITSVVAGSPPRMRGKAFAPAPTIDIMGITPAYAGKSRSIAESVLAFRDHPRVCGEKRLAAFNDESGEGSPPRMRGKAILRSSPAQLVGITPAYAGKSAEQVSSILYNRDHPRVCGEKFCIRSKTSSSKGSPPRMRGKERKCTVLESCSRITPAYAGKSHRLCLHVDSFGDHPRVCGEKTKKIPSHRPFQLHPVPVSFSFA